MLQLINTTPFKAALAVIPDRNGIDTLHVIVKATLSLKPRLALAATQVAVTMADEYFGEPENSSLKLASELHTGKPGTDVLVVGSAQALEGREITETIVTVSAAERIKRVRVSGDRFFASDGSISAPMPFTSLPIVWERAFGGMHVLGDVVLAEERNPIGLGFRGKRSAADMAEQPVPNIEDPATPLGSAGDVGTPVCFAPTSPAWAPRRQYAGTYDAAWQRQRAPYLPQDFDSRFFMSAAPELAFDRYLTGGESFRVEGMHPEGPIAFALPNAPLELAIKVAGAHEHPPVNLETVLIAPKANLLCLSWRAMLAVDRKALKVQTVTVGMRQRAAA
jgi:hypothetical protein